MGLNHRESGVGRRLYLYNPAAASTSVAQGMSLLRKRGITNLRHSRLGNVWLSSFQVSGRGVAEARHRVRRDESN